MYFKVLILSNSFASFNLNFLPYLENGPSVEVSKLKEEVKVLRSELHRAEEELEDRPWVAPPLLQTWLQLIYETGVQQVNLKLNVSVFFEHKNENFMVR